MGELMIFLLFGPALVMGGYFIQSRIFPTLQGFVVSLPFGVLTAAILFANEVPDYQTDKKSRKFTWVNFTGPKFAFRLYYLLIILVFLSIVLNIVMGYLGLVALLALLLVLPSFKAGRILKEHYADKRKLMESSRLTILTQALAGVIIILGVIF
jgi:1,4-dihydroxy-2-naphthoate octaprenyltransferase